MVSKSEFVLPATSPSRIFTEELEGKIGLN